MFTVFINTHTNKAMIGAILAGVSTLSSLYGSIKSAQANNKQDQALKARDSELESWYNKEYNQDYLDKSEARGTLGVCLAPDGNNNAETEYLLEVSKQWHQSMAMAKVSTLGSRIWPLTGDFKETRISTSGHYAHKATVYKHNETHSVNRFTSSRY